MNHVRQNLIIAFFVAMTFIFFSSTAQAHRLNVFAWLENDTILVESDFSVNKPARDASVTVYDNVTKKELVHGVTDKTGRFSFPVPSVIREGHGLLIDVNAGQGHRGEWTMDAAELYAAASLTAGFDQAAITAGQDASHAHLNLSPAPTVQMPEAMPAANQGLTPEHARSIIHEALEAQLAPIRKELAQRNANEPSLSEIIGGIGWIIGLVGIVLYFLSRRKQG